MTEPRTRPRRRGPGPLPVVFSSLATFLVVLTLMAAQLYAGHDPALGRGQVSAAKGGHGVVTRTSGAADPGPASAAPQPVTTRSSGGEEEDDDD
jgi:hypothetical protein